MMKQAVHQSARRQSPPAGISARLVAWAVLLPWCLSGATFAHAYLDPGAGSIAVQVMIGSAAVLMATVSRAWDQVKRLLRLGVRSARDPAPKQDAGQDEPRDT